jgi:chorismate mutase
MTRAVRGAIQVAENAPGAIGAAATRLAAEMLRVNAIAEEMIVSLIFSVTEDLTAANPASALREKGFSATPLFCTQEARVDGGMPRVIRVLLTFEGARRREPVPVYLDGAERLRADLARGERP